MMYIKPALGFLAIALLITSVAIAGNDIRFHGEQYAMNTGFDFGALDTDRDGQVTQSEFLAGTGLDLKAFDLIDTNHDTKLSEQEIASYNEMKGGADNEETLTQ